MTRPTYPVAPQSGPNALTIAVRTAVATNNAIGGKLNVLADIVLTPDSTTTTVIDARIGAYSWLGFMPITANAAAALSGLYVSALGKGTATLTHASSGNIDQAFVLAILG